MAFAAALLAATSGLRNGEIRAIQAADIGNKLYSVKTESGDIQEVYMLYVRHDWNFIDGLKSTKNGERGYCSPFTGSTSFAYKITRKKSLY